MPSPSLPRYSSNLKIAIVGRTSYTINYENALREMGACPQTVLEPGLLSSFDGLILPGGGDITPAFFGQHNKGSRKIDTELDITQLQAIDLFVKWQKPVLGICKGFQIINVYFGGTIIQNLPDAAFHEFHLEDSFHKTDVLPESFLDTLYGRSFTVNSAHHQGLGTIGRDLSIVQFSEDNVPEGLRHDILPIIGVQWHPERLFRSSARLKAVDGRRLFSYFLSLCTLAGD